MTIREQVTKTLDNLSESELHQVVEYLSFLKFRSRFQRKPSIEEEKLTSLYKEFAEEDRQLAEEGMEDYTKDLEGEDTK